MSTLNPRSKVPHTVTQEGPTRSVTQEFPNARAALSYVCSMLHYNAGLPRSEANRQTNTIRTLSEPYTFGVYTYTITKDPAR